MSRILTKKQLEIRTKQILDMLRTDVTSFQDFHSEEKEERVERQQGDYWYFCRTYLPHYFSCPSCPAHEYLFERLEDEGGTSAVAMPRAHAKSTHASFAHPLWKILNKKRKFIVLISNTRFQASCFLRFLRLELEYNERIKADFGDLVGMIWTDEEFITSTGIMCVARGRGQQIRGLKNGPYRPDQIVCDDLESDKMVKNPLLVQEAIEWVNASVLGAMDKVGTVGTVVIVGTMLATKSLLAHFVASPEWTGRCYSAELPDQQPLWPGKYSWDDLQRIRRKMGTKVYTQEYMNAPNDAGSTFRAEWIRYYDPAELVGPMRTVIYVDPSATDLGDHKAVIVLSRSNSGQDYIRHAWIRKTSLDALIQSVFVIYREYKPEAVGWEKNGFQEVLAKDWQRYCAAQGCNPPLILVNHHTSKEARISRLSVLVETSRIRFRKDDPDQEVLIDQLLAYPSSSVDDDGPDALEGATSLLERACVDYHYHPVGARQARRAALREKYRGIYG